MSNIPSRSWMGRTGVEGPCAARVGALMAVTNLVGVFLSFSRKSGPGIGIVVVPDRNGAAEASRRTGVRMLAELLCSCPAERFKISAKLTCSASPTPPIWRGNAGGCVVCRANSGESCVGACSLISLSGYRGCCLWMTCNCLCCPKSVRGVQSGGAGVFTCRRSTMGEIMVLKS